MSGLLRYYGHQDDLQYTENPFSTKNSTKNSSLKKITQNSSKKLKVSVNMKKEQQKLTQIKGKIHHLGYNKVKKLLKSIVNNSPFLRGN